MNSVHSVDVQFISRKNEDYHRQEIQRQKSSRSAASNFETNIAIKRRPVAIPNSEIEPVNQDVDYSSNTLLGLDPVLGDIIFEPKELPIIRGGWYDRNGIYFSDDLNGSGLKSINIIRKGVVDSSLRNNVI